MKQMVQILDVKGIDLNQYLPIIKKTIRAFRKIDQDNMMDKYYFESLKLEIDDID